MTNNKPETVIRAIGAIVAIVICLLGIYATQTMKMQDARIERLREENMRLGDRFDKFLLEDRKTHERLIEQITKIEACQEMLKKEK
jgi:hypothetical protein